MTHRYALLALVSIAFSALSAQTYLTPSEYAAMKLAHTLPHDPVIIGQQTPHGAPVIIHDASRDDGPCDCWVEPDASYALAMYPNDDYSSSEITLPFSFNLFGSTYSSVFINNNGNVSFVNPYSTFTASGFPVLDFPMVAPFWGDVDTRGDDGNGLNGGQVLYKVTPTALYVNWVSVGYYGSHTDKLNTFQLIITDGSDPTVPDGNNVSFCYHDMQWTTGDASGGITGFDGTSATVGVNNGDGIAYSQVGRFSQPDSSNAGPYADSSGVNWLDDRHFYLNVAGASVPPVFGNDLDCDTLDMSVGYPGVYHMVLIAGGQDQNVTCTSTSTLSNYQQLSEGSGPLIPVDFSITPGPEDVGLQTITFTATSEHRDNLVSTYVLRVHVDMATGVAAATDGTWSLGPNPATDRITLSGPQDKRPSLIELMSVDGRVIRQQVPLAIDGTISMDVSSLAQGAYLLRTTTGNTVRTERFVKADR